MIKRITYQIFGDNNRAEGKPFVKEFKSDADQHEYQRSRSGHPWLYLKLLRTELIPETEEERADADEKNAESLRNILARVHAEREQTLRRLQALDAAIDDPIGNNAWVVS